MKRFFALSLIAVAAFSFTACTTTTSEADANAAADSLAAALLQATTPAPAGPVETKLTNDQIPQAVKDHLASTYPDYELSEAEKVEDGGVVTYEVEILVNEKEKELIFDAEGKFVKEEMEEAAHEGHEEGHDHSH